MRHELIGLIIDTVGAFVMMALALWVWRVRPEAKMNRVFAQVVSLLALAVLLYNIGWLLFYRTHTGTPSKGLWGGFGSVLFILAAPFIIKLERSLPDPREPVQRRLPPWLPLFLALLYLALSVEPIIRISRWAEVDLTSITDLSVLMTGSAISIVTSAVLYLIVRLAIRYERTAPYEGHLRWQAAGIALALGAFPLFSSSITAIEVPIADATASPLNGLVLIPMTLATLTWIVAGMGRDGRLAIVTGLSLLALVFAGLLAASIFGAIAAINSGAIGTLRLFGTALLAYVIVRHQLFDIELKIKWTLSRGTVAAIFIATFFVVSELVAGLLSERIGIFFGVFVTGLLVFALAPLQRFAEAVSDRAMPHVRADPDYIQVRKSAVYRAALEGAIEDGQVSAREEAMLTRLQLELGIPNQDVERMRAQVVEQPAT